MILRGYQREAVDSLYAYFSNHKGNPLIVIPTAGGKSFVIATFIQEVLKAQEGARILVLTHVKELIQQNYLELLHSWKDAPAGINSAGLNRRDTDNQIIFAGIQSVHKKAYDLQNFDLILIDECHLVPNTGNTMYRRFLADMVIINAHVKIIGFTATHYRLDSGYLTEGEDRMFTDVAYEVPVKRLINEGYLCNAITHEPTNILDVSGVHTRGGEFINSELQEAVDTKDINEAVVGEMLHYGKDRKAWLIFCAGVDHAYHIRDVLRSKGVIAETITGTTNSLERDYILDEFKAGNVKAVTNCDVLTTGFNHPSIDMMGILRPTKSTGLYVQIIGRGMRISPGKENVMVLDFAGNINRHGPIDMVNPKSKSGSGNGVAPIKTCPQCKAMIFAGLKQCACEYVFPPKEVTVDPVASTRDVVTQEDPYWEKVELIQYSRHLKQDKPDSIKVTYHVGMFETVSEWVCLNHGGYAERKAWRWWRKMGGHTNVRGVDAALSMDSVRILRRPSHVQCQKDGKFTRILKHNFDDDSIPSAELNENGFFKDVISEADSFDFGEHTKEPPVPRTPNDSPPF